MAHHDMVVGDGGDQSEELTERMLQCVDDLQDLC